MVGRGDNAFFFHAFDQGGGAVITDPQPALDVAGGNFFVILNNGNSLRI